MNKSNDKSLSLTSTETIEVARDRLALAIEAAEIGTFYCPMPMGEIIWNTRCKEHFWLAPEAEVDFDLFYRLLHPDDRERTRAAIDAAVYAGAGYDIEYRTLSPRGEVRWIRAKGDTRYDIIGKPIRFDGITIDISAQKRLEAERDRLLQQERLQRQEAQHANGLKDTFLATVSHELRAPLTAILAWVELLQQRGGDTAFVKTGMDVIRRNVLSQTRLVDDLLDLSRVTAGKLAITKTPVCLSHSVEAELSEIRPLADKKGVVISANLGCTVTVAGDASRLRQVFANLLSNALKYTPQGGTITVAVREAVDAVAVSVTDTGEGIPQALLNKIFEPFAQVDGSTTRKHGGLGLGLAIARSLVAMHGGSLVAASEGEDRGATFTLTLPVEPQQAATEKENAATLPHAVAKCDVSGKTVLVIDDDGDTLEAFALVFAQSGVQVRTALSAAQARAVLANDQVDAIFSDISMPGEDGYQLISSVRSGGDNTPAVAVSAFVRDEDRQRARDAGFDEHLAKPVDPALLIMTLGRMTRATQQP